MKLHLSPAQAELTRDAMYRQRDALKTRQIEEDAKPPSKRILSEWPIQECDRIIWFLNNEIEKEKD